LKKKKGKTKTYRRGTRVSLPASVRVTKKGGGGRGSGGTLWGKKERIGCPF